MAFNNLMNRHFTITASFIGLKYIPIQLYYFIKKYSVYSQLYVHLSMPYVHLTQNQSIPSSWLFKMFFPHNEISQVRHPHQWASQTT